MLRLSLPASGDLRAIAGELAAKMAAQFGVQAEGDGGLASTIEELARRVHPAADAVLALEFHKLDRELKIEARSDGRASEARIPLPA